jgi:hypothetical protein
MLIEHRTHRLRCPECGTRTTASLPAGVADSAFGPWLRPAIVTLTARNRISRRGIAELAGELFGARLSTGSVDAICRQASAALADEHDTLRAWILGRDAVHVDETGWRWAGDSRALWGMSTPSASIFQIAQHCNPEQFNQLIGDYAGIVISDRPDGSEHLEADSRQVCWSHIQRDFRRHPEGLAEQQTFGEQGLSRLAREQTGPLAPTIRQQPAQALALALDLHRRRGRRTNQQPSRTRAPRTGDSPKTRARHAHRRRRPTTFK